MKRRTLIGGLSGLALSEFTWPTRAAASLQDIDAAMAITRIYGALQIDLLFKNDVGARATAEKFYQVQPYDSNWTHHPESFLIGATLVRVTPPTEREAYFRACTVVLGAYEAALIYGNLPENLQSIVIAATGAIQADSSGPALMNAEQRRQVASIALAFAALAAGPKRKEWALASLQAVRRYGWTPVPFWEQAGATERMFAAATAVAGDYKAAAAAYDRVLAGPGGAMDSSLRARGSDKLQGIWGVMAGTSTVEAEAASVYALADQDQKALDLIERSRRTSLISKRSPSDWHDASTVALEDRLTRAGMVVVQPVCSWAGSVAMVSARRKGKVAHFGAFNPYVNAYELFFALVSVNALFLTGRDGLAPSYIKARRNKGQKAQAELMKYVDRASAIAEPLIGSTIRRALAEAKVGPEEDVVIVVPAGLSLLPIGLSRAGPELPTLCQQYQIRFVDSMHTAARMLDRPRPTQPTLAVVTSDPPSSDLRYLPFEAACVSSAFPLDRRRQLLSQPDPQASFGALDGTDYWHVASHASWDFDKPERSGLALSSKRAATVSDVSALSLNRPPRLVYLSACETNMIDVRKNLNDFVGLTSAFLAAGAMGAIGAQWAVSDAATALLAVRFYDEHLGAKRSPASALQHAQLWLSRSTGSELQSYVQTKAASGSVAARDVGAISGFLADNSGSGRPFEHPYFWGGFQLYGA